MASSSSSSSSSSSRGGFSIREYTAEMRATDITKCWPFGGCGRSRTAEAEDEVESFLPPIRVVKFRWWSDVLAAARSRNEIDVVDAISLDSVVCRRSGLRSAGVDDDDCGDDHAAEEEAEVGETRRRKKKKKKKKKKRSIVEIFAVSPRVVARAKKEARRTRRKKKRVEVKMKTCGSITRTRVSEAKKAPERNTRERSYAMRIDEVMVETNLVQ